MWANSDSGWISINLYEDSKDSSLLQTVLRAQSHIGDYQMTELREEEANALEKR